MPYATAVSLIAGYSSFTDFLWVLSGEFTGTGVIFGSFVRVFDLTLLYIVLILSKRKLD